MSGLAPDYAYDVSKTAQRLAKVAFSLSLPLVIGVGSVSLWKLWRDITRSFEMSESVSQPGGTPPSTRGSFATASSSIAHDPEYLKNLWNQALAEVEKELGPKDFKLVKQFASFGEFVDAVRGQLYTAAHQSTIFTLLTRLEPGLNRLQEFGAILAVTQIGKDINLATLWGFFYLLVEVSKTSANRVNEIIEILDGISHDILIFHEYSWIFASNPDLEDALVMTVIDIINLWGRMIKSIRRSTQLEFAVKVAFGSTLETTKRQIQKQTSRIKERAQAVALRQSNPVETWAKLATLERLHLENQDITSPRGASRTDNDISIDLPFSNLSIPRDPNFVGRCDTLTELQHRLDHVPDQPRLRSWLIHGMPGVGKTSIAVEYAYTRIDNGVEAVLWIKAERAIDVDISFSNIAADMGLEGAEKNGDHVKNRQLVIKWLQRAKHNWLVIFDNVEDPGLLGISWPSGSHGSILVTSRKDMLYGPTEGATSISPFSTAEGAEYLLKIISRQTYNEEERESASALSREVEDYPLYLNILGAKIKGLNKSVSKYLVQFRQNPGGTLKQTNKKMNPYYPKSAASVWREAFSQFENEENFDDILGLMGIVSVTGQDIPSSFFCPEAAEGMPLLKFCCDEETFDDALLPLLNLSIVQRNDETGNLSAHRVAQERFLEWAGSEKAYEAFLGAAKILYTVFPKQKKGMELRNEWEACNKAVSHVLALSACYRSHRWPAVFPTDFEAFLNLIKSCGWFLMERGSWMEFQDLFFTADMVCEDKESLEWAHILNTASLVESEKGHAEKARPLIEKALEIRERLLPADDMDLSDVYNNFGFMLLVESTEPATMREAIKFFNMAIRLDEKHPDGDKVLHVRYLNMAKAYVVLQDFAEAARLYEIGKEYSERTYGKDTHFVGRYCFLLGGLRLEERRYDDAKALLKKCLEIQGRENDTHPIMSATRMKLGIIEMASGNVDQAIFELETAKVICDANAEAKGDLGDVARALRLLADALEQKGDMERATKLHEDAEAIRREVQGSPYDKLPDSFESYQLMVWSGYR